MNKNDILHSPITWAGGKLRQINHIIPNLLPHINASTIYAEPFLGGGVVFYNIINQSRTKNIVIGDINPYITKIIEMLFEYPEFINRPELKAYLHKINLYEFLNEKKQREFYNKEKKTFNSNQDLLLSTPEQLLRAMFLNRACRNGMYRLNRKGEFNTSLGKVGKNYKHIPWKYIEELHNLLLNRNFESITINHCMSYDEANYEDPRNTVLYLDPPYISIKTRISSSYKSFDTYTKEGFDTEKFAEYVKSIKDDFKYILMNNYDHPDVRELFGPDFFYKTIPSTLRLNVNSTSLLNEVLISNKPFII